MHNYEPHAGDIVDEVWGAPNDDEGSQAQPSSPAHGHSMSGSLASPASSQKPLPDKEEIRRSSSLIDVVQRRGIALKKQGKDWIGCCPFHDDHSPSLRVSAVSDVWICDVCRAGGDVFKFVMRFDDVRFPEAKRRLADEAGLIPLPAKVEPTPAPALTVRPNVNDNRPREVARYDYHDAAGVLVAVKRRFEPGHNGRSKSFAWSHPDGSSGKPAEARTLYRLPEVLGAIRDATTVHVVEGEKAVEAMLAVGLVATTNEDGAASSTDTPKWSDAHASPLKGAARVVVLPDNDDVGRAHADTIVRSLRGVCADVRVCRLDVREKGDVVDFLEAHSVDELRSALEGAQPVDFNEDKPDSFEQRLAQARTDLMAHGVGPAPAPTERKPFFSAAAELFSKEFPATPWLVRGLLTDKAVAAVAGEPKASKTWAALEMAMAIGTQTKAFGEFQARTDDGAPRGVAMFLVEDGAQSTRNRLRALAASRNMLPEQAVAHLYPENLAALNLESIDDLAHIVASVRGLPEPIAALILDPLRDIHRADENDSKAMSLVMRALRALRSVLGCAVVFVHHSAKADQNSTRRRGGQRMRGSSVVHGAIDAGLYLLEVTGNLENEWVNKAQVEVKGARGAGFFTLSLRVLDDDRGEAVSATWDVVTGDAAKARASELKATQARDAVLAALRAQWLAEPESPRPMSERALRAAAGVGTGVLAATVRELATEGHSEQAFKGEKPLGWVYRPTREEQEGGCAPTRTDAH